MTYSTPMTASEPLGRKPPVSISKVSPDLREYLGISTSFPLPLILRFTGADKEEVVRSRLLTAKPSKVEVLLGGISTPDTMSSPKIRRYASFIGTFSRAGLSWISASQTSRAFFTEVYWNPVRRAACCPIFPEGFSPNPERRCSLGNLLNFLG